MTLLSRFGRSPSDPESAEAVDQPQALEGATPGVAAILDGKKEGGRLSILDLGPAMASSFEIYRRFARHVRFADLFATWTSGRPEGATETLPSAPDHPYDLVFGWDVLERIPPEGRRDLIDLLARRCAPGAGLHVIVRASRESSVTPLRFALIDTDRMRYEPDGPAQPGRPPILPAELERLVEPFRVSRAFTLKRGLREYVATLAR